MEQTHGVDHWEPDSCFGCKVKTTSFAPSIFATTPGGRKAAQVKASDKKLEKDLAAFKRIVVNSRGQTMPKRIDGAARVESECESHYEVVSGQPAHKMAKGPDAGKSVSRRGEEWRRRANDAHEEISKQDVMPKVSA